MGRVHPNPDAASTATTSTSSRAAEEEPAAAAVSLTVWRKSLLFGCDGFTVFDARGDLAFRVDSYAARRRADAEVVLMDSAGKPLLTVRRARGGALGLGLGLGRCWVIYDGESSRPLLSVRRRHHHHHSSKELARVTPLATSGGAAAGDYVVEGNYGRRACAVRDARGDGAAVVAEVRRKEGVGDDVFRLVAAPRLGAPLAMGLVIALDEMFAARRSPAASMLLRRTWSWSA